MAISPRKLLAALVFCGIAGGAGLAAIASVSGGDPGAGPAAVPAAPRAVPGPLPPMGVMGTIPIYWGEADELGDLLSGAEPHWARALIESEHQLRPLDSLSEDTLAGLDLLLLAQPRALSARENVALDRWVRDGGRLLLLADPMLTGESHFAIGDRRRPQDVILLSPILSHWGLTLEFVEDQPAETRLVAVDGVQLPVRLAGRFARENAGANCAIAADAVLARCAIGQGMAVIWADAALVDLHDPHPAASGAFGWLLRQVTGMNGENAGNADDLNKFKQIQPVVLRLPGRDPP